MKKTFTIRGYTVLAIAIAVVAMTTALISMVVQDRLEGYQATLRVQIANQEALLATIAETTARNGADSVTESIIQDCPLEDRSRFNDLLGRLDSGLSRSQLLELDQLFGACGSFFAERKAVMVARLAREIEILETYISQLQSISNNTETLEQQLSEWKRVAEGEQTQSVLFSELVRLQKAIINELLAGNTAGSDEIISILNEVRETREALLLAKTQTDTIRGNLTAL